jgi:tetratricopeptide (TPR) repeat protein
MLAHFKPDPPTKETIQLKKRFPLFKTILRAECMDSQEAERLFLLDLKKNPSSFLSNFGLGIVYKERSEYDSAIRHLKIALKEDPASTPVLRNLGETYHMAGQDREARRGRTERPYRFLKRPLTMMVRAALRYFSLHSLMKTLKSTKRQFNS